MAWASASVAPLGLNCLVATIPRAYALGLGIDGPFGAKTGGLLVVGTSLDHRLVSATPMDRKKNPST